MPTMKLTIDIDIELHRQLKAHCAATGVSLKDFVTEGAIARLRMQGQSVAREAHERSFISNEGTTSALKKD